MKHEKLTATINRKLTTEQQETLTHLLTEILVGLMEAQLESRPTLTSLHLALLHNELIRKNIKP